GRARQRRHVAELLVGEQAVEIRAARDLEVVRTGGGSLALRLEGPRVPVRPRRILAAASAHGVDGGPDAPPRALAQGRARLPRELMVVELVGVDLGVPGERVLVVLARPFERDAAPEVLLVAIGEPPGEALLLQRLGHGGRILACI